MNKHYYFSDIKDSVLSDGKWTWKAVDLPSKGVGKFQIEEGYAYVVQFKPKSGLSGLLFGSERQTRIVKSMNRKWGRLYTIFQKIGNNISIVLVKYKRDDCSELEYYYWSNNSIHTAQYKLTIESEVVDPEKFVRFLELPGNDKKLRMAIEEEIYRHLAAKANKQEDIHQNIHGGEIRHDTITEAGYSVRGYKLHFEKVEIGPK